MLSRRLCLLPLSSSLSFSATPQLTSSSRSFFFNSAAPAPNDNEQQQQQQKIDDNIISNSDENPIEAAKRSPPLDYNENNQETRGTAFLNYMLSPFQSAGSNSANSGGGAGGDDTTTTTRRKKNKNELQHEYYNKHNRLDGEMCNSYVEDNSTLNWKHASAINDVNLNLHEETDLNGFFSNFPADTYRTGPRLPNYTSTRILYRLIGLSPAIPSSPVDVVKGNSNNSNTSSESSSSSSSTSPPTFLQKLLKASPLLNSASSSGTIRRYFPSSDSAVSTFYRAVPSLADRGLKNLSRIDKEGVLVEDTKALCLRLCEVSYEVQQDEEQYSELERVGMLLRHINSHRLYRENFRGLEVVTTWCDGAIFYHAKTDTLIAACRGTHTEEIGWARDLGDGFVFGVASRVERLRKEISNLVRSENEDESRRFMNSRVLTVGHSLSGVMVLRHCFAMDNINNVYGVAFNPGEMYLSFSKAFAKHLPGNLSLYKEHNKKCVIVRNPGDMITANVDANCLIIDEHSKSFPGEHRLYGFKPRAHHGAAVLYLEHRVVLGVIAGWVLSLILLAFLMKALYQKKLVDSGSSTNDNSTEKEENTADEKKE